MLPPGRQSRSLSAPRRRLNILYEPLKGVSTGRTDPRVVAAAACERSVETPAPIALPAPAAKGTQYTSLAFGKRCREMGSITRLRAIYPDAHRGFPETGDDEYTTYLHFVVNWLEIFATAEFAGRERAEAVARRVPVYTGIYRTTIDDRQAIGTILREVGLLPLPPARTASRVE